MQLQIQSCSTCKFLHEQEARVYDGFKDALSEAEIQIGDGMYGGSIAWGVQSPIETLQSHLASLRMEELHHMSKYHPDRDDGELPW